MSARPPRFRQRALGPLHGRLRKLVRRVLYRRFVHEHRVFRVRIGRRDYKRVRFGDAWLAGRAAAGLERFAGSGLLPELEARFDAELLVDFVPGRPLSRFDAGVAEPMAAFFAGIHEEGLRPAPPEDTLRRARRDLAFLQDAGILDTGEAQAVAREVEGRMPPEVWVGWDYTDAVPKNFVRRPDGRVVGIDVEALTDAGLAGIGIAKSLARGDAGYREGFLAAFARRSRLDLPALLPFVEPCFQLRWLKNRILKGSPVDPGPLKRLRGSAE